MQKHDRYRSALLGMSVLVLIGAMLLFHLRYGWENLYGDVQLAYVNWHIARDSTNEELYKKRILIYNEHYIHFGSTQKMDVAALYYEDIDRCIQLETKDTLIYMKRWSRNIVEGRYRNAVDDLSNAIKNSAVSQYSLRASLYSTLGSYDSAIADHQTNFALYHDTSDIWMIGNLSVVMGRFEEALDAYRQDSGSENYVMVLLMLGRYEEALNAAESLGEHAAKDHMLAISYYHNRNKPRVMEVCNKILAEHPDDCVAQFLLAKLHYENNDKKNGLLFLFQALENGYSYFDILASDRNLSPLLADPTAGHVIKHYQQKNAVLYDTFMRIYKSRRIEEEDRKGLPAGHNTDHLIKNRLYLVLLYPSMNDQFPTTFFLHNYSLFDPLN